MVCEWYSIHVSIVVRWGKFSNVLFEHHRIKIRFTCNTSQTIHIVSCLEFVHHPHTRVRKSLNRATCREDPKHLWTVLVEENWICPEEPIQYNYSHSNGKYWYETFKFLLNSLPIYSIPTQIELNQPMYQDILRNEDHGETEIDKTPATRKKSISWWRTARSF